MKNFKLIALFIVFVPTIVMSQTKQLSDFEILDSNQDGVINPYEAFDMLMMMQKESKRNMKLKNIPKLVAKIRREKNDEINDMIKEFDKNNNNIVERNEVNEEFAHYFETMDRNDDGSVTKKEMIAFNPESIMFQNDKEIKRDVKALFKIYGKKNIITLEDLHDTIREGFRDLDFNKDGKLLKEETFNFLKANNSAAEFTIRGDIAYMTGCINGTTPAKVLELIFEHPNVKTIEMIHVPGSIDDVANLRASQYIHKFGINTRLNPNSIIASGGTDFFLAGKERRVALGAKIGVHSWGGGAKAATSLSKKHKAHKKYLNYYKTVGIAEEFYWYTLKSATANDIHYMSAEEIERYKIKTEK